MSIIKGFDSNDTYQKSYLIKESFDLMNASYVQLFLQYFELLMVHLNNPQKHLFLNQKRLCFINSYMEHISFDYFCFQDLSFYQLKAFYYMMYKENISDYLRFYLTFYRYLQIFKEVLILNLIMVDAELSFLMFLKKRYQLLNLKHFKQKLGELQGFYYSLGSNRNLKSSF